MILSVSDLLCFCWGCAGLIYDFAYVVSAFPERKTPSLRIKDMQDFLEKKLVFIAFYF
jgi:hypothetical protein